MSFKKFLRYLNLIVGDSYAITDTQYSKQVKKDIVLVVLELEEVGCDLCRSDTIHDLPVISYQFYQHSTAGQTYSSLMWKIR